MQRTKMSMIVVAGTAVVIGAGAATAAEASPAVTRTAAVRVPGVVGDAQATAYGKISKAGLRPRMSATTHPVRGEILYVESQAPGAGREAATSGGEIVGGHPHVKTVSWAFRRGGPGPRAGCRHAGPRTRGRSAGPDRHP